MVEEEHQALPRRQRIVARGEVEVLELGKLVDVQQNFQDEQQQEANSSADFDPKIAARKLRSARPALPAQTQVAQDRDVIEWRGSVSSKRSSETKAR